MPERYLDGIDLGKTPIINMILQHVAGDYTSPIEGLFYYDPAAKQLAFFNGIQIMRVPLTGGGGDGGDADTLGGNTPAFYLDRQNHTGTQTAATISDFDTRVGTLTTGYIDSAELEARIASLVDSAPGLLDTLNELAAALGDDPNFAATVNAAIAERTRKYATLVGDGVASEYTVTHNLGSRDVQVSTYFAAAPFGRCHFTVEHATINAVTLRSATPIAVGQVRAVVIG